MAEISGDDSDRAERGAFRGISPDDITHLAKLARLTLSAEEKKKFAKQLPGIVAFVEQLQGFSRGSNETDQTTKLAQLRDDITLDNGLTLNQLKQLAPDWKNDQVVVPAVFGGDNG